jgi:hypothetical protein
MSLITLLFLSSGPAYAEWVVVSGNDEVGLIVYVDQDTIRRKGNLAKMWSLMDFKTAQRDGGSAGNLYLSLKAQREYDCADEYHRTHTATWFSGNMGRGSIVNHDPYEKKWSPVEPDSINRIIWKVACGKQ